MQKTSQNIFAFSALLLAIGIAAAAFGAHGLKGSVEAARLEAYQTAGLYHLLNAIGLLILCIAQRCEMLSLSWLKRITSILILGIFCFSGSLYLLVLLDIPRLGIVTPIGGTLLILGWLLVAVASYRSIRDGHLFQPNPSSVESFREKGDRP